MGLHEKSTADAAPQDGAVARAIEFSETMLAERYAEQRRGTLARDEFQFLKRGEQDWWRPENDPRAKWWPDNAFRANLVAFLKDEAARCGDPLLARSMLSAKCVAGVVKALDRSPSVPFVNFNERHLAA